MGTGVDDAAALAGWPLRWWQPASLALAVAARAQGGSGVRHQSCTTRRRVGSSATLDELIAHGKRRGTAHSS
jgi:hypothetical protein